MRTASFPPRLNPGRSLGLMIVFLATMSCTRAEVADTPSTAAPSAGAPPVQPNGLSRTLELGGPDHQTYLIEALDPPTHTFEVRLVVTPPASVRLWFHTPYGVRLDLVRNSTSDDGCVSHLDRIVCVQEFAALEAQHPGRWTLHVRNASETPTTADITVTFTPL